MPQLLYVQEVVTLQRKNIPIYLHQKIGFTPFFNYYDINIIRLQSKLILGHMNYIE